MKTLCPSVLLVLGIVAVLAAEEPFRVLASELIEHYQRYDGKQILIEGDIVSGPEMTVMYLGRTPTDGNDPNGMLVLVAEAVSRNPSKVEKRFNAALKKKGRVHAVLEGQFNGAADRQWGHQLCCRFKVQIEKVISVR